MSSCSAAVFRAVSAAFTPVISLYRANGVTIISHAATKIALPIEEATRLAVSPAHGSGSRCIACTIPYRATGTDVSSMKLIRRLSWANVRRLASTRMPSIM